MNQSRLIEQIGELPTFTTPSVSPSGDRMAFVSDEDGTETLYVKRLPDGQMRRVTTDPELAHGGNPLVWLPDETGVVFQLGDDGHNSRVVAVGSPDDGVTRLFERDGACAVTAIHPDGTRILFRSSEQGPDDVYEYSRESETVERLTDRPGRIAEAHYGPDGTRIVYRHSDEGTRGKSVHILDRETGERQRLDIGSRDSYTDVEAWNPVRNVLLVEDDGTGRRRAGVYDVDAKTTTWLTDDQQVEAAVALSPDGSLAIAGRVHRCRLTPVAYNTETGDKQVFDLPDGFGRVPPVGHTAFRSNDTLVLTQQTPTQPQRVLQYDLTTDTADPVYDPAPVDTSQFTDCRYERIESDDGLELETLVFDAGERPSPLVVQIHGGPVVQDYKTFDRLTQSICAAGYSVAKINYRGSRGRGTAFRRRLIGDLDAAQRDVGHVTRTIADRSWIDENRIAAVGDSFGGYCVLMRLASADDVFDAGIAWGAQTDLSTLMDTAPSLDRDILKKFSSDWTDEQFRELSPITHAGDITDPLCIIHGTEDERVPIEQTREFVTALQDGGRETEPDGSLRVHELDGLGHHLGTADVRKRMFRLFVAFLDDYLGTPDE